MIARELPPLFKQHWRELGRDRDTVILDPDWDKMMALSVAGLLKCFTARAGDSLVGYIFTIIGPHLHYKTTLHSVVDMYWLHPGYRRGWQGMKFWREFDRQLKTFGVVRSYIGENLMFKNKNGRMMRVLLKRLGYKACDVHYRKIMVD